MHVHVPHVLLRWLFVRSSCKPSKSVAPDVNPEGINSKEQDVDAQVKLETFHKERVCNVVLGHHVKVGINVLKVACQENALALRHALWLHDEEGVVRLWFLSYCFCSRQT